MRALCVSDKVVSWLYNPSVLVKAADVDVIFGCGDLPYYYLEYLLTMLNVPLFYVHGNHDPDVEYTPAGEPLRGPGGGINLDGKTMCIGQLLVAGLEGSIRYRDGLFQYTDAQMWRKALKLAPKLYVQQTIRRRPLDILVAHSPPLGIHNGSDHVHRGFTAFLWLMRVFKPRYLIHGHHHVYRNTEQTVTRYHSTIVNNIYPYKILDIADRAFPRAAGRTP